MNNKKILVTGGLGFIGSHTVVALINKGFKVIIIDNLSNCHTEVLNGIQKITGETPEFHEIDLREKKKVKQFFEKNDDLLGIIHFAASKSVGESIKKPLMYYENNLCGLLNILSFQSSSNLIFSSSCTVYGEADKLPISENAPIKKAESPYGNTKQIGEEIIRDFCRVENDFKAIALRYFNPIGAHSSAEIGELPLGTPQNLIPYITQTAIGQREYLSVFGNDYFTVDGTPVRDYIHVMDLAEAHVAALNHLIEGKEETNYEVFNLGTGRGNSVLQVIRSFEKATGQQLFYKVENRREGDITAAYANVEKANKKLGWQAVRSLEESLKSAWEWQKRCVKHKKYRLYFL
jgi:UDP-glucose 4-epimerase